MAHLPRAVAAPRIAQAGACAGGSAVRRHGAGTAAPCRKSDVGQARRNVIPQRYVTGA
jgi:hypothetical protein